MNAEELNLLQDTELFRGITRQELEGILTCLGARRRTYEKGENLARVGEPVPGMGVLLSGTAQIVREDYNGAREIVSGLAPGDLFAEVFACVGLSAMPVSVLAAETAAVLWIDPQKLASPCEQVCPFHKRLTGNLLGILAGKALGLSHKLEHLSKRSTRDKLLSYLNGQAALVGADIFTIPFDRQQLADYLCVDRSAMSAELGRLRDEGVLEFHRSTFRLLRERG